MPKNIEYKKELFDFVNSLREINNAIAFEIVDDRVVVNQGDKFETMAYELSVPKEYFDIDETVAFYKYDNFYRFLNTIKDAKLSIQHNEDELDKMIISGDGVRINYILSEEDGIIGGMDELDFDHGDVRFSLTKEDIEEITKINNLIKGDKAHIHCKGNKIKVTIYSDSNKNSFDKVFTGERLTDYEDEIEFDIFSNRFHYIPAMDYTVDICNEGFVAISLIHDDIVFDLYSGDVE